jgi:hypothetical protein
MHEHLRFDKRIFKWNDLACLMLKLRHSVVLGIFDSNWKQSSWCSYYRCGDMMHHIWESEPTGQHINPHWSGGFFSLPSSVAFCVPLLFWGRYISVHAWCHECLFVDWINRLFLHRDEMLKLVRNNYRKKKKLVRNNTVVSRPVVRRHHTRGSVLLAFLGIFILALVPVR